MNDTCDLDGGEDPGPKTDYDPGPGKHVLFFADPMCSWCWGFAPELTRIADALQGRATLHIIMGGLRPDTREAWDSKLRSDIRHHWNDVHARTGQPFDYARCDDETFVYDTEPSCRAVVVVRTLDADKTPVFLEALQRAFYADGRDITTTDTLTDIASECEINPARFKALFSHPQTHQAVRDDFVRTRAFGVAGFPSIVCAEDAQYARLTAGYQPFALLAPLLEAWLNA